MARTPGVFSASLIRGRGLAASVLAATLLCGQGTDAPCNPGNGWELSDAYPCTCGTEICTEGELCDSAANSAAGSCMAPCSVTDRSGLSASYPCACGTATCTAGEACDSGMSYCQVVSDCSVVTHWYDVPSNIWPCFCGSATCTDGEACDSASSSCTAACSVSDGSGLSDSYPCTCDTQICTAGNTCLAGGLTSIPACRAPTTTTVADTTTTVADTTTTEAPCSVTDGLGVPDSYPCTCGTATCTNGQACLSSESLCQAPCSSTWISASGGFGPSDSYPCICGSDVCEHGEWCDSGAGVCVWEGTTTAAVATVADTNTTVTEGPTPRHGVSPGDEVEVRCASGGNSGYHPARVHNVSAGGIVVAYQHLGHLYFCAPKQWRMVSGLPRVSCVRSCAEHGGISPAWGGHKCCPASCGTCGTPDCHLRPGGKGNCCTNRIPDSKACGHNGNQAPCSIAPCLPEDIAPAQRRLRGLGAAEGSRAEAPFWVQDATDVAPAAASSAPTDDGPEPPASMTVQIRA